MIIEEFDCSGLNFEERRYLIRRHNNKPLLVIDKNRRKEYLYGILDTSGDKRYVLVDSRKQQSLLPLKYEDLERGLVLDCPISNL